MNTEVDREYNEYYSYAYFNNILMMGRIRPSIRFKRPAEIAFLSLLPTDKKSVEHSLERLAQYVEDPSIGLSVQKLKGSLKDGEHLYMIRANSELRILFRHAGKGIEIIDILPYSRLKWMHALAV